MSEKTNIEWATHTFNPWLGCTKVSPGCKNCYAAELDANRFSKTMDGGTKEKPVSHWGKGAPRHRTKGWNVPLRWDSECGVHPGYRARVFPSLMDWLDDEVPIEWLADFLKLIHDTPNLDWLLLTKRPGNFEPRVREVLDLCNLPAPDSFYLWLRAWIKGQSPANVWVGVSVEDQKRADERIPLLLQIPAKVRFLSVEPLLEKIDLTHCCADEAMGVEYNALTGDNWSETPLPKIDWLICGGESGKDRRECGVEAICDVARQCVAAGVPVFVKQDSAFKPGQQVRIPNEIWALKQFPKL